MKIVSTYWNAPTRESIRNEVEVELVKTYKGHDIYRDNEDWYYVNDGDNYQYFDSVREAQKFIRDTAWEQ